MLPVLVPVYQQLLETCDAVKISVRASDDEHMGWRPAPDVPSFAQITMHLTRANLVYASVIGPADVRPNLDMNSTPAREWLLSLIDESLVTIQQVFEGVTETNLHDSRADDWCPNCEEQLIPGPLDALWFALQMVRHTGYHLGQLNIYLRIIKSLAT